MNGISKAATMAVFLLFRTSFGLPADFERTEFATGFNSPLAMRFAPDGRLFVLEQAGKVRVVKNGALLPAPFATVQTWAHRESMLGVAFDPKFAENGYVYLYYSSSKQKMRISRLTSSKDNPDVAAANSETVLLDSIGDAAYQGGAFFFGKDGMLYAGSAHGGSQITSSLAGKALRINPAGYPNVIPADNPFVGKAGYRPEIYALGFREPFSGAADPVTGDMVFLDVGEGGPEEIDLLKPGANYGYEGGCEGPCTKAGMENPWLSYPHSVGNCITGAAFYQADAFPPEYKGALFFADWGASWIKRRDKDGKMADFDATSGQVIQLDVGPDGSLYLLKINGQNIPWTGSVLKVRYTKAVSLAGRPGKLRHDGTTGMTSLGGAGGSGVKYRLRIDPLKDASLQLYDAKGKRVGRLPP
jgi:glucose/arabinose dehydrogenase